METTQIIDNRLTKEEAIDFFSEFYGGSHHIPGYEPKPHGSGWIVKHDRGDLGTYDFSQLTKLVVMAHDKCIRVGIEGLAKNKVAIVIHKRQRTGGQMERHPTLENAMEQIREQLNTKRNIYSQEQN